MSIFELFITDFFLGGGGGNRAFEPSGNNGALRCNILVRKQKHNVTGGHFACACVNMGC